MCVATVLLTLAIKSCVDPKIELPVRDSALEQKVDSLQQVNLRLRRTADSLEMASLFIRNSIKDNEVKYVKIKEESLKKPAPEQFNLLKQYLSK